MDDISNKYLFRNLWKLIQAIFELGGKAAAVVLDDADLDVAADKIVFAGLMHAGQICMSTVVSMRTPN